jgi:nucleotide-binding universal stress UspA family protein
MSCVRAASRAARAASRAWSLALATDFPRLWNDPKSPQRERKRMVRLLLEGVTLTRGDDIVVGVRFRGGATQSLSMLLAQPAWQLRQTSKEVVALIDKLLDAHTDGEIARILNERGLDSGEGKAFHHHIVARVRRAYELKPRHDRLRDAGMLTLAEIALQLGVATPTVKTWRNHGLLRAHAYNDKGGELIWARPAVFTDYARFSTLADTWGRSPLSAQTSTHGARLAGPSASLAQDGARPCRVAGTALAGQVPGGEAMTKNARYKLVVALDSSDMAATVLDFAFDMAGRHQRPELHLLTVVDTGRRMRRRETPTAELEAHEQRLRAMAEEAVQSFGWSTSDDAAWTLRVHVRAGVPEEEIVELAAEARADMIVLGQHGERGRRRFLAGAVPERVLRTARCPVFVVQPTSYEPEDDAEMACAACEAVRRDSDGERWFCPQHTAEIPIRSAALRAGVSYSDRGGSLWF